MSGAVKCYNNPLNCADPSGYFVKWLEKRALDIWRSVWRSPIGRAFVGVTAGYFTGGLAWEYLAFTAQVGSSASLLGAAAVGGFTGRAISTGSLKGGLQGAFSAGMFYGAGNVIGGGNFFTGGTAGAAWGLPAGVALHGVVGCVTSVAGGGKCGPGALSAAFSKMATPLTGGLGKVGGTIASAVIGETASELGGGKFSNGAMTGAFSYLYPESVTRFGRDRAKSLM